MARKTGLGRGLDALIPSSDRPTSEGVTLIPLDQIKPNPRQPRTHFDPQELEGLAESIRQHGIIQPLILTQDDIDTGYYLVAGERRWLAARQAGLRAVPALVRTTSDQQRLELALIENVQRADLSPLETAEAFRQLAEEFSLSHEDIAARVGKSRVAVTNTLRLLKLPSAVKQALADKAISEGHARALLMLSTSHAQVAALQTVLRKDLNVRQTEALVRAMSGERPEKESPPPPAPEIKDLQDRLQARLGTRVRLNRRGRGGNLVIYYYSDEELDSLLALLLEQQD
jgi:ParB family chromosome partitioning protein